MNKQLPTMPVVPAYKPDPELVQAIRAQIERNKLKQIAKAVRAARSVA